ncbi:MFS transporter [Rahnella sp. Lac-M11]|jgi:CP family cyanate transporter-like MFS transporter|uniref:MFS transporter n=1 Tax=Rahnella contaminans TaxID=2703882 RepID=A0A6M2B5Y7_9GAMM|nr:MFS transporter [Rahnella contaminans]NGX88746.1 MFS transporter [Rahnella contaminans]
MTQPQTSSARPSFIANSAFFLFLILLTAANLRSPITATGPVLADICATFGLSASAAGLLNFIPLILFAAIAPLASWCGNKTGLEKSLWVAVCLITLGSVVRVMPYASGLWAGTVILSTGIAAANVLLPPLIKRDFKLHTTKYIGLYASTMAITASLASGIAAPLQHTSGFGWRLSLGIWIVPALIATVAWLPLLKNTQPRELSRQQAAPGRLKSPWKSMLGWQVSLFMALQSMVFYTLIDWFTPYASSHGISQESAGWMLFVYQAVAIVANLVCMTALKKYRDQRGISFIASLAIFTGLAGLLIFPALPLLWLVIAGLGAGASMVICLSLFNLRATDHRQAAALSGMAQCVGYGVAALGPLVFGMLHEVSHSWTVPLIVLTAVNALQLVIAPLAGRAKHIG